MKDIQKEELMYEMERCVKLFNSQVFIKQSIFTQSAFIEIMIRLNYVLQALNKNGRRITWKDDINSNDKIKDITDLVNNMRNAACHQDSPINYFDGNNIKFVFNIFKGKSPNAIQINDTNIGCEYEDDIAFYYGAQKIYLFRHIKKLLEKLPSIIRGI